MATNEAPSQATSDEITPLLANERGTTTEDSGNPKADEDDGDDTPMPRKQILVLCFARLLEPIAFFSIFSFINKMVWETGNVKETDVGFYSGLIVRIALRKPEILTLIRTHRNRCFRLRKCA